VDWGYLENYHPLLYSNRINADSLFCALSSKIIEDKSCYSVEDLLTFLNSKTSFPLSKKDPLYVYLCKGISIRNHANSFRLTDSLTTNKRVEYNDSTNQFKFYTTIVNRQPFPCTSLRILGIAKIWNNYKFYYPYQKNLPNGNEYENILMKYLRIIKDCKNFSDYHRSILAFTSEYKDTHSKASSFIIDNQLGKRSIPAKVRFIEGNIVISDYYDKIILDSSALKIGDQVLQINGEETQAIFDRIKPYIAYSNEASLYRDLSKNSLKTNQDSIRLLIRRSNKCFYISLPTYESRDLLTRERKSKQELSTIKYNDSTLYVQCKYVDTAKLRKILFENNQLKWFIFDLRSSTKWIKPVIEDFFFGIKTTFALYYVPLPSNPGNFTNPIPLTAGPAKPGHLKTNFHVIILVNENTQSQGEFQTMILQAIPNSLTIGSMTAGTDGNTSNFMIPGNISIVMTLVGIQYPNNQQTQSCGVHIDYYCTPDIKSVILGIDQELEMALDLIKKGD
jgi:C-terminal processing protease CtpA/Prc